MDNNYPGESLEAQIKSYLSKIPHFNFTPEGFKNIAHRFDVSVDYLQNIVDAIQPERNNSSSD